MGCATLAIDAGCPVEGADDEGWSPLLHAAYGGHCACARLLLRRSANPNACRANGLSPLMAAAAAGEDECMRVLLAAGADATLAKREGSHVRDAWEHAWRGPAAQACVAVLAAAPGVAEGAACQPADEGGRMYSDRGAVAFRMPPAIRPDEGWQERPVRRCSGRGRGVYRCSGLRHPHNACLLQLILRDHGFEREREEHTGMGASCSLDWPVGPIDARAVQRLLPAQKLAKFPGSSCLTLKSQLWRRFEAMRAQHGAEHFDYMPAHYTLPDQLEEWRAERARAGVRTVWLLRSSNASCGGGIEMVVGGGARESTAKAVAEPAAALSAGVACEYVDPPLLLDGTKWDLRLYALVTSWDPLALYMYGDGLARFATLPYAAPLVAAADSGGGEAEAAGGGEGGVEGRRPATDYRQRHLTNYALNPTARRLTLAGLRARLQAELGESAAMRLWRGVDDLVCKTMLSVAAEMADTLASCSLEEACGRADAGCFQLFGLDVMVDAQAKPWLIEVNLEPSLAAADVPGTPPGSTLRCKAGALVDLLNVVGLAPPRAAAPPPLAAESGGLPSEAAAAAAQAEAEVAAARARRLSEAESHEDVLAHLDAQLRRSAGGGWRRLLPSECSERYAQFVAEGARRARHSLPFATR